MKIRACQSDDREAWDAYVRKHPHANHCHLFGWKPVIEGTYGHPGVYLAAETAAGFAGVLPLVHVRSLLFGSRLVSMPFLNYGSVLADTEEVSAALVEEAVRIGAERKATVIDLRSTHPLGSAEGANRHGFVQKAHKIRMLLTLPESGEALMKGLKAKVRSQVRRPEKEGMEAVVGGAELLDAFYAVFSVNMRDLGSPVHARGLFERIFRELEEGPEGSTGAHGDGGAADADRVRPRVRIGLVRHQGEAVAAGLIVCFRDLAEIPWASSRRAFNRFSPNMLVYGTLLSYAADHGYRHFDFGRSTPDEGTYRFKRQWGAEPAPLYWYVGGRGADGGAGLESESKGMGKAIAVWQRLPVPVANWIGPKIRGAISL